MHDTLFRTWRISLSMLGKHKVFPLVAVLVLWRYRDNHDFSHILILTEDLPSLRVASGTSNAAQKRKKDVVTAAVILPGDLKTELSASETAQAAIELPSTSKMRAKKIKAGSAKKIKAEGEIVWFFPPSLVFYYPDNATI